MTNSMVAVTPSNINDQLQAKSSAVNQLETWMKHDDVKIEHSKKASKEKNKATKTANGAK